MVWVSVIKSLSLFVLLAVDGHTRLAVAVVGEIVLAAPVTDVTPLRAIAQHVVVPTVLHARVQCIGQVIRKLSTTIVYCVL